MKKKGLLKLVVPISLVAVLAVALPLTSGCRPAAPPAEVEPVVMGFIGSFATDTGRSTLRSMEIAIEEFNEAGGILGGRPIKLVKADSAEDVTEGIKAYEYLNEVEHVDVIISGVIDDVTLGFMPRLAEYKTPTVDTWTSAVRAIELVRDEYGKYKSYFLNFPCDWLLGAAYIDFGKEVLKAEMGYDTCVLLNEDTAYACGVAEFIMAEFTAYADIEIVDHIVYDVDTIDFSPIYAGITATDPDFVYYIASVNCVVPTSQYVELRVPIPLTGINVAAFGKEFWTDTGGMGAGVSVLMPGMNLGMEHDPRTQAYVDKYIARWGEGPRPVYPHFNGFTAYYGVYQAVNSAEMVYQAGLGSGFEPLDAWVEAMEGEGGDIILYKDNEIWWKWGLYAPGEVEPFTGVAYTHNGNFDMKGVEGMPSCMVAQWHEDGTCTVIWPDKYGTGEFELPWWIEE